ncbi:MAG: ABC transporter permease subunit [Candidatus Riflebacteria bacterium]|nr:ABC transporter permease subunit [Candidatus Riflebacteria bacterium]
MPCSKKRSGTIPRITLWRGSPRKFFFVPIGWLFFLLLLLVSCPGKASSLEKIKNCGELKWGADAEGGGPYVFPDPKNPMRLVGFEVDLMDAIARGLGVKARQCQNAWESLIPALLRGDFDILVNGLEITPSRASKILFTRPYYVYFEQIVVRKEEEKIREFPDLCKKIVGTLSGTIAHELLTKEGSIVVRTYSGQAEPFEDLVLGRLDAVLFDFPVAHFYGRPNPKLKLVGTPLGKGFYGMALRQQDTEIKDAIDSILEKMISSGELRRIYEKWGLWNEFQNELISNTPRASEAADLAGSSAASIFPFFPDLLKGAMVTLMISVISMALAIALGLVLALLKVYSRSWLKFAAMAYIEIYRGTPLLIQLYVLYYGLPNVGISLSPLMAAFLGLGMNYAAYEAELYRAGINAIPKGQMEAAMSLGMSEGLALRRIILPQAFRIALPGITNDFIALFKDSSLVSVIAMVELTKTYNILAASTLRFFELGLITGFLYFAMSFPLSLFARSIEGKLKGNER